VKIGELLLKRRLINSEKLIEALGHQISSGLKLGSCLVTIGAIDGDVLADILGHKHGAPIVTESDIASIPADVIKLIPKDVAVENMVIPFRKEGKRLFMAMINPDDIIMIDKISFETGLIIKPHSCSELYLAKALAKYYSISALITRYQLWSKHVLRIMQDAEAVKEQPSVEISPFDGLSIEFGNSSESVCFSDMGYPSYESELTVEKVCHSLVSVTTRAEVIDLFLTYVGNYFESGAVLIFKEDKMYVWHAIIRNTRRADCNTIGLVSVPDVVRLMLDATSTTKGKLCQRVDSHVVDALSVTPAHEVNAIPLTLFNRVIGAVILVDPQPNENRVREVTKLSEKIGMSFEVLILRKQILA